MVRDGKICRQITYKQMGSRAQQIGLLLMRLGVKKGQKVLLLSENCPEWPLAYFGIALAGAVSVPLLTGFSAEQIRNVASHAEISAVCISRAMTEKFDRQDTMPEFSHMPFIYIDSITDDEKEEITVSLDGVKKQMSLHIQEECENILPENNPNDLASIIYTSGTQGNSKGVMLSGANLIFCALSSMSFVKLSVRDRFLSVLPLAHSYECSLGLLAPVINGAGIIYFDKPPSPSALLPAAKMMKPTVILTVPLLIEKIYRNAIAPQLRCSRLYKCPVTRFLALRFASRKLIVALGGHIRFFGTGGAPLSAEVEKFLHNAGFPYTTGYGLTEAAPLVCGNTPKKFPLYSAGSAAKGVMIRIVKCASGFTNDKTCPAEGEIQVCGPNVMIGYYNDKERTAEAFTSDGWLRTGDLGHLDKKGRLHIRGRLKTLILGPSGENIYPEEIENLLGTSRLVEDALVYSGEKGELVALVSLSDAAKAAAGAVEHALEELRSWVNKKLAVFSRLSRIEIKYEPFEKTPTMKIKRYLYS